MALDVNQLEEIYRRGTARVLMQVEQRTQTRGGTVTSQTPSTDEVNRLFRVIRTTLDLIPESHAALMRGQRGGPRAGVGEADAGRRGGPATGDVRGDSSHLAQP